jgi:DNA-directed RNA polymerase III subunit RPC2
MRSPNNAWQLLPLQELSEGIRTFDDFIHDGLVEYLDVNEMNDASIAVYDRDIGPGTTHVEVG